MGARSPDIRPLLQDPQDRIGLVQDRGFSVCNPTDGFGRIACFNVFWEQRR